MSHLLALAAIIHRPKCDGFMVGSNKTDPSIGAVNIVHEGPEECKSIQSCFVFDRT
jgi:hypothetical protein